MITDPIQLAGDRRDRLVDSSASREALQRLGFEDGAGALDALDALLSKDRADLDGGALLAGCVQSADPGRALYNVTRLAELDTLPTLPVAPHQLAAFVGATQHMADLLVSRPSLVALLGQPFDPGSATARYDAAGASDDAQTALRHAQQVDLLAIAWSDLVEGLDVEQTTILLSRLADAILCGAAKGLGADRYFGVIALGKLGGLELNYSSDIDLMFVRPDTVSDQVSADNLARRLIKLLGAQTSDGHLYRVDMRLRPEGASGALTRTVSSSLEYYRTRGRPWEGQMLTKARLVLDVGGAVDELLSGSRAWILERGLDAAAMRQFKRLKSATEAHHASKATDVKQAPGGIRDIETIVQFLALLHARHNPYLICNATLHGLERLRVAKAVTSLEVARLRTAYLFHRRVENLLQVMHRVQTHRLPADCLPLARLMGRGDAETFLDELGEHRRRVRSIFEHHFGRAFLDTEGQAGELTQLLLETEPDSARLAELLSGLGFSDGAASAAVLILAAAPVSRFLLVSPRLRSTFASVAPRLLERLALAADPDMALERFERMTRGVGAREILYERLQRDGHLLELMADMAAGSAYLAEILIQEPQLFDGFQDALVTGLGGRQRRREELVRQDAAHTDPWHELADYKRLESLRIGVRDLTDGLSTREVLADLSHLCVDVLRHAFDLVLAEALREHGQPHSITGVSGQAPAHMIVLALGKVGGLEANYGSDADVIFVYSGDGETTRGTPNSVFFSRVAEEFIARVSGSRGGPRLYKVDARLRPEGSKGPLVTSMRAFQKYYSSPRAALFEHLAMLKARVVAGDAALGQKTLASIRATLRHLDLPADLPAQMKDMRAKIEARAHGHDLKRGTGGMVDIEQMTQCHQLRQARRHSAVLVQDTPRALELLAEAGALRHEEAAQMRDTYLFFRRVETRLQVALGLDTKEVPDSGPALRSLALRLGYVDTAEGDAGHLLLSDLEEATQSTRSRYERFVAG